MNETTNNSQIFLKIILVTQTVGLLIYTLITIQNDGLNFLQKAIEFATSLQWIGQFSVDFSCYLLLSGLWIMWRNEFSTSSIAIAVVCMILGIIVFAPYLLYLLSKEKGDLKKVLVGNRD